MTAVNRRSLLRATAMIGFAPLALSGVAAAATDGESLDFILHATFFSRETRQPRPLDPHAFVRDAAAPAAIGPQNIAHAAGFRPAWVTGPFDVEVFNAQGKSLGFTLADWFAARGIVRIAPSGRGARLECRFTHLRPNGVYSLFENHFDRKPVGFTPLDGTATTNSFTADASGNAAVALTSPRPLTHDNAVLLVYHSDNATHGMQRGAIGVTAHHQIIVRIPS